MMLMERNFKRSAIFSRSESIPWNNRQNVIMVSSLFFNPFDIFLVVFLVQDTAFRAWVKY